MTETSTPSTPSQTPERPTMVSATDSTPTFVKIGGNKIELRDQSEAAPEITTTLYKKEKRAYLSEKDRVDLFKSATHKHSTTFFDLISTSIDSADKLDDCYNVDMKISKTSQRHKMYDMHDVFNVMLVDGDGRSVLECYDLYTQFPTVTPEMVAASNQWYNTWPQEDTYRENLNLTAKFFENNCSPALFEKVSETYDSYKESEKGGPLFFIIMVNAIMSQTEEASLSLQSRLKRLDLKDFPGENVDKVVGLVRAVIRRLRIFNRVPEDLTRTLLRIFQTSSVPDFNQVFANMEQQRILSQITTTGTTANFDSDTICKVAGSVYRLMTDDSQWTGASTLGTDQSVFVARTCWNCGGSGHDIKTCRKPKNEKLIEVNKKKFQAAKKEGRLKQSNGNNNKPNNGNGRSRGPPAAPGTGKWRRPEPAENNRRVIDGKPMFWRNHIKRWVPDRDDAANVAGTSESTPSTPSTTSNPAPATTMPSAGTPMASVAMNVTPSANPSTSGTSPAKAIALHKFRSAFDCLVDTFDHA